MAKGKKISDAGDARPVPGFNGRYVVDFEGTVYRCWKTGCSPLIPVVKRGNPVVRLTDEKGRRREMLVARIVQTAWLGPAPKGCVRYHKNGSKLDNCVGNIGFITRSELGRRTGGQSRRRPVLKVDPAGGEAVCFYPSARQAAKANFMSYQTVMDCCNRKTKRGVCPDGYRYSWQAEDGGAEMDELSLFTEGGPT